MACRREKTPRSCRLLRFSEVCVSVSAAVLWSIYNTLPSIGKRLHHQYVSRSRLSANRMTETRARFRYPRSEYCWNYHPSHVFLCPWPVPAFSPLASIWHLLRGPPSSVFQGFFMPKIFEGPDFRPKIFQDSYFLGVFQGSLFQIKFNCPEIF